MEQELVIYCSWSISFLSYVPSSVVPKPVPYIDLILNGCRCFLMTECDIMFGFQSVKCASEGTTVEKKSVVSILVD